MAKIEDMNDDWGGIENLGNGVRLGFGNDWLYVERTLADGTAGVYNVPHIPPEQMASFLEWKAGLVK